MAPEPPEPDDTTQHSDDSLLQFPINLVSPTDAGSDAILQKFRSIVRDEINAASRKLSAELVRGLKELGHHTNQLEQRMDVTTTVLEGHEDEVERLNAELVSLQDKLEDSENRARRDNLRIRGLPETITDLQGSHGFLPRAGA